MPRWLCIGASAAAPSWPRYLAGRMSPLPEGSVPGSHIPNDFTPLASGAANTYREYTIFSVEICPDVRQAAALVSPGFGSTSLGQRFAAQGSRFGGPCLTSKIARHAM